MLKGKKVIKYVMRYKRKTLNFLMLFFCDSVKLQLILSVISNKFPGALSKSENLMFLKKNIKSACKLNSKPKQNINN